MISRTLGPEFGGAIGTLFFLANVVGSALAISGCVEGIVENLGPAGYYGGEDGIIEDGRWWRFFYCTLVNTLMLIVCLVGASLFAKTNVIILGIVIVCLLSTFISFLTQGSLEVFLFVNYSIIIIQSFDLLIILVKLNNRFQFRMGINWFKMKLFM